MLLPPQGTKIEPARGIFLRSLERAPNTLWNHQQNTHMEWGEIGFRISTTTQGCLGKNFFNVVMYLWVKNAQWKSKYLKGFQCLGSKPGYSIPIPLVPDCVRHHPRQNIHPTPCLWPSWHSQSSLQGINPNQPPWLWFNNRVMVHNCPDFALFIPVFLYFLQTRVQTRCSFTNQL